jgi:hypothetical protein
MLETKTKTKYHFQHSFIEMNFLSYSKNSTASNTKAKSIYKLNKLVFLTIFLTIFNIEVKYFKQLE